MTGPPAAGKTTVAAALREGLGLPLLAKDSLKEVLAEPLAVEGRAMSRRLGEAVFSAMGRLVQEFSTAGISLIVEGNFARAELFESAPARFVQVHVSAPPAVVRARLAGRKGRHSVHYDAEAADEIAAAVAAREVGAARARRTRRLRGHERARRPPSARPHGCRPRPHERRRPNGTIRGLTRV